MRDETYSPFAKAAPRTPHVAERIWTMTKGGRTYHADLFERHLGMCELQIFLDGEFRVGHLHKDRAWALTEAALRQETLRVKGWSECRQGGLE